MDWKAVNEQQREALWLVFLMFVAMALLIIRTGLVSRGIAAPATLEELSPDDAPPVNHKSAAIPPSDLYQATLVMLCLAEVAGRLLIMTTREVWELMNQPLSRPAQERPLDLACLCERLVQRLDTS